MDDLLDEFIAETRETLEALSGQMVQWEKSPEDLELIDSAFRFVHTVKGSCGFLDLPRLMRLSHAAEDVLSAAREGKITASAGLVTATLEVIDQIGILTEALVTGDAVFDTDSQLIENMLRYLDTASVMLNDDVAIASEAAASVIHTDEGNGVTTGHSRNVRVNLATLDNLMNAVSDLVLARNEMSRQLRRTADDANISQSFTRLSTSVAEIRDAIGVLRMQNIDRLFAGLPRLLRDTCLELDKRIELVIEGGEVEIDREMVEALRDPLVHILRNAADHGIESADERIAAGKEATGLISISARQSGNQILLEISDDGRGINLDKLGDRAIRNKLVTENEWLRLSDKDKYAMICSPGLSTTDSISSISGRGVGMDVVNTNIRRIGGSIDIQNNEGSGLKITLRLPLTLSIISGLFITAGETVYGISRNSVIELIASSNPNVAIEYVGTTPIACVRGIKMPYIKLETILDVTCVESSDVIRTFIVMRPAVGPDYVLDVEKVLDTEELVVKPGAPLVMNNGLYSGISLPDTGKPMLLLDASGIAAKIDASFVKRNAQTKLSSDEGEIEKVTVGAAALLFIGIDQVKRAIRLSSIDRMEDVLVTDISCSNGQYCVSSAGALFDVVGMNEMPTTSHIKFLRLSDGEQIKYFPVADVLDIFSLPKEMKSTANPEIFEGLILFDNEPIELINSFQFFGNIDNSFAAGSDKPMLFVECSVDDHWERHFLAPMLIASGYDVSFDDADKKGAAVILTSDNSPTNVSQNDSRLLQLRSSAMASVSNLGTVYRYDRVGIISAMAAKISGSM
jgi:two-component system, chemotaxis family, sensor kinase CheA